MRALPCSFAFAVVACSGKIGPAGVPADGPGTDSAPGSADARADAPPGPTAPIHLLGRFTAEANPRFAWPGSSIVTRFDGTSLSVRLDDTGDNRFEITLDGKAAAPLIAQAGAHDYVLASGLPAGPHDLRLARRTESFFNPTTFLGFPGATLIATPAPGRWIELIGDSITCGYGVLGPDSSSCFSKDTEAETRGWAQLAADQLGAAHTAIAYSGKGMVRNGDGSTTDLMPALFERTFADDATSTWAFAGPGAYQPDVVVVDLGTNDFATGDPMQAFVTGYQAFLVRVRQVYPSAWIIVAQSPMLSDGYPNGAMQRTKAAGYFNQIVDARHAAGDSKVTFLDIAEQLNADGYGCDYHPSAATHQKMAAQLVTKIRAITGW